MLQLYVTPVSSPCRFLQMVCAVVGEEVQIINIQLGKDNLTPEYLAMNPLHTVPTLKDDDLVIADSRAAGMYLASVYGKDRLYPMDPRVRAKVDYCLFFDAGTLYKRVGDCVYPVLMGGEKVPKSSFDSLHEVLGLVNDKLTKGRFVAGTPCMTIADLAFLATLSTMKACEIVDCSKYKGIKEWFERMKSLVPEYEKNNGTGAAGFGGWYKSKK